MKTTLNLTPELTKVLSEFCDEELLEAHASALDKMEDFLLNNDPEARAVETIANIITLRDMRQLMLSIREAMTEGGEENG